jgi:hypothetical protein
MLVTGVSPEFDNTIGDVVKLLQMLRVNGAEDVQVPGGRILTQVAVFEAAPLQNLRFILVASTASILEKACRPLPP